MAASSFNLFTYSLTYTFTKKIPPKNISKKNIHTDIHSMTFDEIHFCMFFQSYPFRPIFLMREYIFVDFRNFKSAKNASANHKKRICGPLKPANSRLSLKIWTNNWGRRGIIVYIEYQTVRVPSSELGPLIPFPASECVSPPWTQKGGGVTPLRVREWRDQIPTTGNKALHSLFILCDKGRHAHILPYFSVVCSV